MNESALYLALLRGINVGGNNKVEMKKLAATFEKLGYDHIKTYINTGNVFFATESTNITQITKGLEKAIEEDFGFKVKTQVISVNTLKGIADALPAAWQNNDHMKCDVMFLWKELDSSETLGQLPIKEGIDEVKYVPGAILWRVDRDQVTRSGLLKIVGTNTYKQMTIRNCNTVRKLVALADQLESEIKAE